MYEKTIIFPGQSFEEVLLAVDLSAEEFFYLLKNRNKSLCNSIVDTSFELDQMVHHFFNSRKHPYSNKAVLRSSSKITYEQILNDFQSFCSRSKKLKFEITESVGYCTKFLKGLDGLSNSTLNKYIAVFRAFLKFVVEYLEISHVNAPKGIKLPFYKLDKFLPRALYQADIKELFRITRGARHYPVRSTFFMIFMISTGLRREEFQNVQLRDINFKEANLSVRNGKGGNQRQIPLEESLLPFFETYFDIHNIKRPTDYIYGHVEDPSRMISCQALDQQAQTIFSKLKRYQQGDETYGYTLHCTRHTYATTLLLNGTPLRVIADLLGHSSLSTTNRYTVLNTEELRTAASRGLNEITRIIMG